MKSDVTTDRATSVMSSWCLEISCSSRSNGPSKLPSVTEKPASGASAGVGSATDTGVSVLGESTRELALGAPHLEVGQRAGDRRTHEATAVDLATGERSQLEPRLLDREQLVAGQVDRHLLVVLDAPAAGRRYGRGVVATGATRCGRSEELVRTGQVHASGHRCSTSLAS